VEKLSGRLDGKVAIITGAGSGMGRAASLLFTREGAKVVAVDFNPEGGKETINLVKKQGGTAIFVQTDVSKASEVEKMVKTAVEKYGRIDILYNNAGISGGGKPITDLTEEEWDRVININLKGTFLCSKYVIPEMLKIGRGSIINIGSEMGIVGMANGSVYSASKGGIHALTRSIAAEYAQRNIRVNSLAPGTIETPMATRRMTDKRRQFLYHRIAMGRLGEPEEVAAVALFLASDEASYVTGVCLTVGGGEPELRSRSLWNAYSELTD
jgi:NAD(P)-dependent dehydrogenase (short-subunit alcohol dehydrogenase family)